MKILIMVLSYNETPFSDFLRVQQETWDSFYHKDVDVRYYFGHKHNAFSIKHGLQVDCTDDYDMMHYKFKLACDRVNYKDYDFIFRTNSCSYIVKDKLLEVAATLPKTNCYAGWCNGSYISGAGIFFSPDVLDRLLPLITSTPHGAEDVLIGELLSGTPMVDIKERIDATVDGVTDLSGWHYRFKTSNDAADRHRDINNMVELHKKLTK